MSGSWLDDLPPGPLLLVADNDSITRNALAWARAFRTAGRIYRVRVAGPSPVEAIAQEAESLGAVALLWSGSQATHALAAAAAQHLAIPLSSAEDG